MSEPPPGAAAQHRPGGESGTTRWIRNKSTDASQRAVRGVSRLFHAIGTAGRSVLS